MRTQTVTRPILPVCLLVADKPCLVVGGGQIATRKVGHLLDAGADVTVVSPEVSAEIQALAKTKQIRLTRRTFQESDVEGQCLVFATTDSVEVNRCIIEACRKQHVQCSASDSNWPDGDLILPATYRQSGLVVTVSTGGRSCLQARQVKDKIAEMLSTLTNEASGDDKHDDR
ncbi:MAG: bifunctional precorrin-2 dehydrogenase/sirohydrochlorin ferrochelatase [bacterium]